MIAVDKNLLVYAHRETRRSKLKLKSPSLVLEQGRISGPQVHDARVAAICRDSDVHELWTSDRDFSHFPTLTVVNPLVG